MLGKRRLRLNNSQGASRLCVLPQNKDPCKTYGAISTRVWLSNHTDAPVLSIACSRAPCPEVPDLAPFAICSR